MIKVGLLVIATNNYIYLAQSLFHSMQQHFLNFPGIERRMYLFTNRPSFPGPVTIGIAHEPWPYMTLKRYEIFMRHSHILSEMHYLYYCDADMIFVDTADHEVLGERVATKHPGYWNASRDRFPYETNPISTAYVPPNEGTDYYAGGFNGGRTPVFLEMARTIAASIRTDLERGYIAVWHDESHLNKFLIHHPPSVVLTPSYCFPEADWAQHLPFPRRLVARNKDHQHFRS